MAIMQDGVKQELLKGNNLSMIVLVDSLIAEAQERRASDIHIVPSSTGVRVRFRIDGVLQDAHVFPKEIHNEVVSRIKVLAGLRTDEHQATQDGRFRILLSAGKEIIDIRVSIAPTYHGENVVLRLLSDKAEHYSLEMLGFSKKDREKILKAIKKPSGMILATGPTGSGKTTTLYTLIKLLNSHEVSIVTLEDPIEYAVDGIEQIQTNSGRGLTFANGLRSILRQDPDIIMVGEIRDPETASIAVNTALTGHLLLSTLHTSDAATTLPRLLEMDIEPYLVASTVNVVIGQRLVRRLCDECKEKIVDQNAVRQSLQSLPLSAKLIDSTTFFRGKGCDHCSGSGYIGRLGVNEVLVADNEIREAILAKALAHEIRNIAVKNGMTTMLEDGFEKVREGLTTADEILRVIHE